MVFNDEPSIGMNPPEKCIRGSTFMCYVYINLYIGTDTDTVTLWP